MSYQTEEGLPAEVPRTPREQQRFVIDLHQDWCGRDRGRLRGLAALTLQANGWTLDMVHLALGWSNRSGAKKAIERTRTQLQQHFAERLPGLDQRDQGFVHPD